MCSSSRREPRVREQQEVREVETEVSRDGGMEPATAVGDAVSDVSDRSQQHVADASGGMRQAEQCGGDRDGKPVTVLPVLEAAGQTFL